MSLVSDYLPSTLSNLLPINWRTQTRNKGENKEATRPKWRSTKKNGGSGWTGREGKSSRGFSNKRRDRGSIAADRNSSVFTIRDNGVGRLSGETQDSEITKDIASFRLMFVSYYLQPSLFPPRILLPPRRFDNYFAKHSPREFHGHCVKFFLASYF